MRLINRLAVGIGVLTALGVSPATAGFVPGGGNSEADCYAGVNATGVTSTGNRIECTEGDPCDVGGCGDGKCTFEVAVCVNQAGIQGCTPPASGLDRVQASGPLKSTVPATLTGAACGSSTTFELKLKGKAGKQKKNKRAIRMKATAAQGTSPRKDQDSFLFVCLPRTTPCSPSGAFVE